MSSALFSLPQRCVWATGSSGGLGCNGMQVAALHTHSPLQSTLLRFRHEDFSSRTSLHSFTHFLKLYASNRLNEMKIKNSSLVVNRGQKKPGHFKLLPVKPCSHSNRRKNSGQVRFFVAFHILSKVRTCHWQKAKLIQV